MPATTPADPQQGTLPFYSGQPQAPRPPTKPALWVEELGKGFGRRLLARVWSLLGSAPHRHKHKHYIRVVGLIERRSDLWGGAAVLAGTRIPVFAIVDAYQDRELEGVLASYPTLTKGDIYFALAYSMVDPGVEADRRAYLNLIPPEFRD